MVIKRVDWSSRSISSSVWGGGKKIIQHGKNSNSVIINFIFNRQY